MSSLCIYTGLRPLLYSSCIRAGSLYSLIFIDLTPIAPEANERMQFVFASGITVFIKIFILA